MGVEVTNCREDLQLWGEIVEMYMTGSWPKEKVVGAARKRLGRAIVMGDKVRVEDFNFRILLKSSRKLSLFLLT